MVTLTWALVRHLRQSQKSLLYPSYTSAKDGECNGKELECMGKGRVRSRSRVSRVQSHDPDSHMGSVLYCIPPSPLSPESPLTTQHKLRHEQ